MSRRRPKAPFRAALLLMAIGVAACAPTPVPTRSTDPAASTLPSLADLGPGWSTIHPGGETICAQGTAYSFFVRPAPADLPVPSGRLVIYLQGGGACWTGDTCDPESNPTYSRDVDETDNPAGRPVGIFDFDNPANPLAGDSFVMIPYCTGDVHLSDKVATYLVEPQSNGSQSKEPDPVDSEPSEAGREESYEVTVHHKGYVNAMAAIEWAFANFESPAEVLVTGSSGGSIPAPFYGQVVAEHYPEAQVTVLGDGAGSYRRDEEGQADPTVLWEMLKVLQHQPGYEDFAAGGIGYHDLYIVAGRRHPEMRLFEYDAANDAVQGFFLRLSGASSDDPAPLIRTNQGEIRDSIPNFGAYIAGGREHTILWRRAFYQYQVDGLLFRDWFAAVVSGEEAGDVDCVDCERVELRFTGDDRRILAAVADRLSDEPAWERSDDGTCPARPEMAQSPGPARGSQSTRDSLPIRDSGSALSLRCAVEAATAEVLGQRTAWSAARLEVQSEILVRLSDADPRGVMRDYNNRESTTFADIQTLLSAVQERIGADSLAAGSLAADSQVADSLAAGVAAEPAAR